MNNTFPSFIKSLEQLENDVNLLLFAWEDNRLPEYRENIATRFRGLIEYMKLTIEDKCRRLEMDLTNESQELTLAQRAGSIARSAERLLKLCNLNAPGYLIETERHLLMGRLINFPAHPEFIAKRENVDREMRNSEQKFLIEHGYYKELEIQLGLEDKPDGE